MLKRGRGQAIPNDLPLPPRPTAIRTDLIASDALSRRSWIQRVFSVRGCFAVLGLLFMCAFFSVAATELGLLPDTGATQTAEAEETIQAAQWSAAVSQAATEKRQTETTIVTLTPSDTPTVTFTPSKTLVPTATRTATITLTPIKTHTPTATGTPTRISTETATLPPTMTSAPKPTEIPLTPWRETYYTTTGANLRPCPYTTTQCAPIGTLSAGTAFVVSGAARGETVAGSAIWFKGSAGGGREGYIHSSILSSDRLAPAIRATPTQAPAVPAQAAPAAPAYPADASAICNDGTYSFSAHRRGTCSHHGGVKTWLKSLPP